MSINNSFLVKKTKSFAAVELEFFFEEHPVKRIKIVSTKGLVLKPPQVLKLISLVSSVS